VRLQKEIGVERIAAYGRDLATYLHAEFSKISGLVVLTSARPELRASMVTISHPRATAGDFFTYLLKTHGLRCRPVTEQKLNAVRVSTHVINSPAECERVVVGVRAAMRDL
jgi:selenocysteine lyase/cysteine desulfurase